MEENKVITTGLSPPTNDTDCNITGKDNIRVVSVFVGNKTASETIHNAVVKKILYNKPPIS